MQGYHALQNPALFGIVTGSADYRKAVAELLGEAEMLMSLRHANVLRFYGMCVDAASATPKWIVIEKADATLERHLKSLPVPLAVEAFVDVFGQLLHGLVYLHNRKPLPVIHRDLKLDNVFCFMDNGKLIVKIGDVGLARFADPTGTLNKDYGGAAFYLAPEILLTGKIDGRADVFSLAMMMAEVALCYLPVGGSPLVTSFSVHYKVADRYRAAADAAARLRHVSPPLAELLLECCDGDVDKRPSSLAALTRLHGMFGEPLVARPPVIQDDPIVSNCCLLCGAVFWRSAVDCMVVQLGSC